MVHGSGRGNYFDLSLLREIGMCAKLRVPVSSRHSGPALIAVSTSSTAQKAVPISAAAVSVPSFAIRSNDMRLEIERRNCRPSITSTRVTCTDHYKGGVVPAHWGQPGGMISPGALDSY